MIVIIDIAVVFIATILWCYLFLDGWDIPERSRTRREIVALWTLATPALLHITVIGAVFLILWSILEFLFTFLRSGAETAGQPQLLR
ncbi:MAG: hypothetical protein PHC51_04510 [bacterium]|nr:hypothetical protein [bacterium]